MQERKKGLCDMELCGSRSYNLLSMLNFPPPFSFLLLRPFILPYPIVLKLEYLYMKIEMYLFFSIFSHVLIMVFLVIYTDVCARRIGFGLSVVVVVCIFGV